MASSDDAEARLVWARDVDLDEKMKEQEAKARIADIASVVFKAYMRGRDG